MCVDCGPPAPCRWARRRHRSSARSASPAPGRGGRRRTRGISTGRRVDRAEGRRPPSPPGWSRSAPPATAAARRASPPRSADWSGSRPASAARALAEAAGLELVDRPIMLTDPVRTWLSSGAADLWMDLEEGMYPEQADDLDPLSRVVFDATVDLAMPRYARIVQRRAQLEQ